QAINAMLNVFFGVLATGDPAKADAFMKDRAGWLAFTSMALVAAWRTPKMRATSAPRSRSITGSATASNSNAPSAKPCTKW
ncbi:MAG: hypothetical protein ACOVSV_11240, partial [Fimbriimonadaceae bacterium]